MDDIKSVVLDCFFEQCIKTLVFKPLNIVGLTGEKVQKGRNRPYICIDIERNDAVQKVEMFLNNGRRSVVLVGVEREVGNGMPFCGQPLQHIECGDGSTIIEWIRDTASDN